jgi:hypothetical protein
MASSDKLASYMSVLVLGWPLLDLISYILFLSLLLQSVGRQFKIVFRRKFGEH